MSDERAVAVGRAGLGGCAFASIGLAALGVLQVLVIAAYCLVTTDFRAVWFVFPLIWTTFWGLPGLAMLRATRRRA